jgi:hypothetical protein
MRQITVISSTVPVWVSYLKQRGYVVHVARDAESALDGDVVILDSLEAYSEREAAMLLQSVDDRFAQRPLICLCDQQLDTNGYVASRPNRLWLEPPVANMLLLRAVDAMATLNNRDEQGIQWMTPSYATAV